MKLKVLDLFSGIGGFSLGLERTGGFETVAFCEIDKFCQKVLNKHWPQVPIFEDVKIFNNPFDLLTGEPFKIDVICGGFPCQDISVAGKQKGIEGERSGLWKEFHRLIKEIQPRYVIIENVANLRNKGLGRVLKDLWEIGYSAEWHIISARSVGACHLRERIWIIAYPNDLRLWKSFTSEEEKSQWWTEATAGIRDWWEVEPSVCRVDDGLSGGLDKDRARRIKALGNSIVPQIAELIGKRILKYERSICPL